MSDLATVDFTERYWIRKKGQWREVFKREFIGAERQAGFYPKSGSRFDLATGGFSDSCSGLSGRVTYGEITGGRYGYDPEFFAVFKKTLYYATAGFSPNILRPIKPDIDKIIDEWPWLNGVAQHAMEKNS
ncbi:MAG: hypothetical protein HYT41_01405 [Candidatus Sungbacteria bacterium]|nr:hypothetical protein [Candidatus Sungbacteria bacterium]